MARDTTRGRTTGEAGQITLEEGDTASTGGTMTTKTQTETQTPPKAAKALEARLGEGLQF